MVVSFYYLIYNTSVNKYSISWKFIISYMALISFLCITHFFNIFPSQVTNSFSGQAYWSTYIFQLFSGMLSSIPILLLFISGPLFALYLLCPDIHNIFSSTSKNKFSTNALLSIIATIGGTLLYRPIKYLLYENFSNYMNLSSWSGLHAFSAYIPGYALLLPIILNTIWLSVISLFFYNKYMDFQLNGKHLKKNLILFGFIFAYLNLGIFVEETIYVIPHYLSRIFGLIVYLTLIKYFWKNNPLSHLFGTLIYFQSFVIINFIQLADPTIKIQGWIISGLFILLLIYSLGLDSFKKLFFSRTN